MKPFNPWLKIISILCILYISAVSYRFEIFSQSRQLVSGNELEDQLLARLHVSLLPDEDINLAEIALTLCKTVDPDLEIESYLDKIDQMAEEIKQKLPKDAPDDPGKIIQAINKYLYRVKKARVDLVGANDTRDKFLLNNVLDSMKGNCLGFSTLYLCLAERLHLSLTAVIIPQHVFLRYEDRHYTRNIETTSGGKEISEEDYLKKTKERIGDAIPKYSIGQEPKFRSLSKKQFIGLILYNRAVDYHKRNETEKALRDFSRTLLLDPDQVEAYKNRGALYLTTGEFEKAVQDFQAAIRLEPNCPGSCYNLGTVYFDLNELNEAIKYFDKTLALAPDYAEAYHNRGVAYSFQREYNRAIADLDQALALNPKHAPTYYNRGLIYFNKSARGRSTSLERSASGGEDLDRAIKDYSRAIDLDPKYTEAYNNRGITYCQQKKWKKALDDFKRAISITPDYLEAHRNLGMVYFETEQYESSLKCLRKYLELVPEDSSKIKEVNNLIKEIQRRRR